MHDADALNHDQQMIERCVSTFVPGRLVDYLYQSGKPFFRSHGIFKSDQVTLEVL